MLRSGPKGYVPVLTELTTWMRDTEAGVYFEVYTQTHTSLQIEQNGMKVTDGMPQPVTHEMGKRAA